MSKYIYSCWNYLQGDNENDRLISIENTADKQEKYEPSQMHINFLF